MGSPGFLSQQLENVKEGTQYEEKDSFDQLNFSNDINLTGMKLNTFKELETRLTSTLQGIQTTYQMLSNQSLQPLVLHQNLH
jgi:hypothetical protein